MTGTDHHIAGLGNLIEWTNISGQNDPSGKMSSINLLFLSRNIGLRFQ